MTRLKKTWTNSLKNTNSGESEDTRSPANKKKTIVLDDDVLNSCKTLMYAVKLFLDKHVKKINTVILVDRSHTRFPVKADYVGLTLSTTLQEHIETDFTTKEKEAVYLL